MRWWLLLPILLVACGEDPVVDAGDGGVVDSGTGDSGTQDSGTSDSGVRDSSVADVGPLDGSTAFGFQIRVPVDLEVPCTGMFCGGPTTTARQIDYVCDLRYNGFDRYVYVQSSPLSQLDFMGLLYRVDGAFISDGTNVSTSTAVYSWGGNHHNDSLTFDATTYEVRYDHSSYGFGFRQCQPMDCLVVYEPGPGAELANGCNRARTLPTICKEVTRTGTVPEWVDTFHRCPGDN